MALIIGTDSNLEINKIYHDKNISDKKLENHKGVSFMVLRIATEDEWRESTGWKGDIPQFAKFYEISVD